MSERSEQEIITEFLREIGRKGGAATGRRAGRRPIPDELRTPDQKKRRLRYEKERWKKPDTESRR